MTPTAPTDQPETDPTPATDDTSTVSADDAADASADDDGKHGEAQRYRQRLRAAEGERDTLAGRVAAMETRHVERLASLLLAQGDDLLGIGNVDINDLRGDDGEIDDQLVTDAIDDLLGQRPGLAKPPPPPSFDGGQRSGSTPRPADWQKVIRGR